MLPSISAGTFSRDGNLTKKQWLITIRVIFLNSCTDSYLTFSLTTIHRSKDGSPWSQKDFHWPHRFKRPRQEKIVCRNRDEVTTAMNVLLCLANRFPDVQFHSSSHPLPYTHFLQAKETRASMITPSFHPVNIRTTDKVISFWLEERGKRASQGAVHGGHGTKQDGGWTQIFNGGALVSLSSQGTDLSWLAAGNWSKLTCLTWRHCMTARGDICQWLRGCLIDYWLVEQFGRLPLLGMRLYPVNLSCYGSSFGSIAHRQVLFFSVPSDLERKRSSSHI